LFDGVRVLEVGTWIMVPAGEVLRVVRAPVTFDDEPARLGVAPEFGQHTEELLLELGHSWEHINGFKESGVIP
jgi:crotonobetainyl-CoA:carnitine CoA-transferase CaiB-like acyl-CoA transferase